MNLTARAIGVALVLMNGAAVASAQNATPDGFSRSTTHAAREFGLYFKSAWARLPAPGSTNTAAYLVITNKSDSPVRLMHANSATAEAVELHAVIADDQGVMRMRPLHSGIMIEARDRVELKPGGMHVMLIGLVVPLAEGEAVPLSLHFHNGLAVDLQVPVQAPRTGELSDHNN